MIKKGSVVSLSYVLTNTKGEELDRGTKEEPFVYLQGARQIIAGLEKAMEGLKTGDKKKVTVAPKEGYGEVSEKLRTTVKKDVFPKEFPVKEGVQFEADLGNGSQGLFTIKTITGEDVVIDANHPLAGETLHFDVEVLEVREATAEELSHGHVHGKGGAHD